MVRKFTVIIIFIFLLVSLVVAVQAVPEAAQIQEGRKENASTVVTADTAQADGGNVSEINISTSTRTALWQGFFGVVNGSLVLSDASGDTFYSWNITNTSGEIYVSSKAGVSFSTIRHLDGNCSEDTPLTGFDLADSANNTYKSINNVEITVGVVVINASSACSVQPYVSGVENDANWHNMMLTDSVGTTNDTIYATPIEATITGYDGGSYDYQILVPVDTATGFLTYSFYAEIA